MNEEYRGIYFQNKNSDGPQKEFYEHGAHFEYKALYRILAEIIKKIKPRINCSLPKKKNISLNKKKASSCRRKKLISNLSNKNRHENIDNKNNIKVNLHKFNIMKNKNNKKEINNSLIYNDKERKYLSCEKNIKKNKNSSFNNKINHKNTEKKKHIKYNSSINNNSMEFFYNDNKCNLNDFILSNYKEKKTIINLYKKGKNIMKFNAIALSDFSKRNDNIIFSYNNNFNKDISAFVNKNENKYFTEKNQNLITKENKKKEINFLISPFNIKDQSGKKEKIKKNKINISDININNIKSGIKYNCINKKRNNINYLDNSLKIKTPKYIFVKNINEKNYKKNINNKINKISQQIYKHGMNKISVNEYLKLQKTSKNQGKPKLKISRNKENLKTANSFFNEEKQNQLTLNNYNNNSLIIKNETEKIKLNIDNSDLIKEKEEDITEFKYLLKNSHSVGKRDIKKYIKNKILEKNKLELDIKEKVYEHKISDLAKNEIQIKININKEQPENKKEEKHFINYSLYKKGDNIFTGSTKSNNDSINKSISNKNGDKKSIISTNLTSHINSKGLIIPLYRKKIDINNV